jgi:hypothetical protein
MKKNQYSKNSISSVILLYNTAMTLWQNAVVLLYGLISLIGFIWSYKRCRFHKDSYGHPPGLYGFLGAFVWADLVIFGAFWALASGMSLILQDWLLFLLIISLFWLIRSIGETMYWFLQQFAPNKGNPPEKFWFYRVFHNDSVWFVWQIYWQCVTVLTVITSLYLGFLWIKSLS